MEPTIYKPSIYKGAGIYKTGAEGGGGGGDFVNIGGRNYEIAEINGVKWLKENLDLFFSDLNYKPNNWLDDNKNACYFNGNSPSYNGNGLIYNGYALDYLNTNKNTIIPGFRLPSRQDFLDLFSFVGNDVRKLFSDNCGGTNETGLSFTFGGWVDAGGNKNYMDTMCFLWTNTAVGSSLWTTNIDKNYFNTGLTPNPYSCGCYIRLIVDD